MIGTASSLSPEEMTVDPTFVLNRDLSEVEPTHVLDPEFLCHLNNGAPTLSVEASQRLVYPESQIVIIPSEDELDDMGMTAFEYVVATYDPAAALYIERYRSPLTASATHSVQPDEMSVSVIVWLTEPAMLPPQWATRSTSMKPGAGSSHSENVRIGT